MHTHTHTFTPPQALKVIHVQWGKRCSVLMWKIGSGRSNVHFLTSARHRCSQGFCVLCFLRAPCIRSLQLFLMQLALWHVCLRAVWAHAQHISTLEREKERPHSRWQVATLKVWPKKQEVQSCSAPDIWALELKGLQQQRTSNKKKLPFFHCLMEEMRETNRSFIYDHR